MQEWELIYCSSCCRALYVEFPAFSGSVRNPRVEMQPKFALRPDSSVVERGPEKAGVGGSIPSLATTFRSKKLLPRSFRTILVRGPEKAPRRRFNPVSGHHPFSIYPEFLPDQATHSRPTEKRPPESSSLSRGRLSTSCEFTQDYFDASFAPAAFASASVINLPFFVVPYSLSPEPW